MSALGWPVMGLWGLKREGRQFRPSALAVRYLGFSEGPSNVKLDLGNGSVKFLPHVKLCQASPVVMTHGRRGNQRGIAPPDNALRANSCGSRSSILLHRARRPHMYPHGQPGQAYISLSLRADQQRRAWWCTIDLVQLTTRSGRRDLGRRLCRMVLGVARGPKLVLVVLIRFFCIVRGS